MLTASLLLVRIEDHKKLEALDSPSPTHQLTLPSQYICTYLFSLTDERALIELLYAHGARIDQVKNSDPCRSLLVGLSGLRLNEDDPSEGYTHPLSRITKEQFDEGRDYRFGKENPEKMHVPFWNAMVESACQGWDARKRFLKDKHGGSAEDKESEEDEQATEADIVNREEPTSIEEADQDGSEADESAELDPETERLMSGEAIWCIDRWGQTLNRLPDGTTVQIGGEHEDFYDPDFMIYNDVIVHHPGSTPEKPQFDIYGYPEDVFPPTDFHTATYVPDRNAIYVIGSLGYSEAQAEASLETPVYRLTVGTWKFEKVETTGEGPGRIHRHEASVEGNKITVKGNGKKKYEQAERMVAMDGKREMAKVGADEAWVLDLESLEWNVSVETDTKTAEGS